jgi:acetyltransferase-like isoleucine patch superfamily enzyme
MSPYIDRELMKRETIFRPVRIKRGAYIGSGSIILPGVTIGERAVIGAGSVVTRDVHDDYIAAGVPAKCLHKCGKYRRKERMDRNQRQSIGEKVRRGWE